jgi:hypothetical protein
LAQVSLNDEWLKLPLKSPDEGKRQTWFRTEPTPASRFSSLLANIVSKPLPAIGFLTALEDPQHGFFGGYLILSQLGRPLEFHCSTPVMPNQAQRILYGKTLATYVLGDLIGQTLLTKSQLPVPAVLTDQREMLGLSLLRDEIVICVESNDRADDALETSAIPQFMLGGYRLFGTATCVWQPNEQQEVLQNLAAHVDLAEPFERIREAIREAQRVTDHTTDERQDAADAA